MDPRRSPRRRPLVIAVAALVVVGGAGAVVAVVATDGGTSTSVRAPSKGARSGTSPSGTTPPRVTPSATAPSGVQTPTPGSTTRAIFDYTPARNPTATVAKLPGYVRGVSWLFEWKQIEPTAPVDGVATYDWTPVEDALAASTASGRTSMLRIFGGRYSPSWVQPQVHFTAKVPGGGSDPANVGRVRGTTTPIPWSTPYVTAWTTFIKAYGAKFDGDPRIYAVQMPGAGLDGEMSLPQNTNPPNIWTSTAAPPDGSGSYAYSDARLLGAWDQIVDAYHQAFPKTRTALDFDDLAGMVGPTVVPAILAHAQTYGSQVMLQQNGLYPKVATSARGRQDGGILATASRTTTIGWQAVQGGNTPKQLTAMLRYATATHATYLEIYPTDIANADDAGVLGAWAT